MSVSGGVTAGATQPPWWDADTRQLTAINPAWDVCTCRLALLLHAVCAQTPNHRHIRFHELDPARVPPPIVMPNRADLENRVKQFHLMRMEAAAMHPNDTSIETSAELNQHCRLMERALANWDGEQAILRLRFAKAEDAFIVKVHK